MAGMYETLIAGLGVEPSQLAPMLIVGFILYRGTIIHKKHELHTEDIGEVDKMFLIVTFGYAVTKGIDIIVTYIPTTLLKLICSAVNATTSKSSLSR